MTENKSAEEIVVTVKFSLVGFVEGISKLAESIRKLLQKVEKDKMLKEQLESIVATASKPPDTTELLKSLSGLLKEFKEIQGSMEAKNRVRQSWKYNSYRTRFNSRITDKREICHNCRDNC